MGVSRHGFLHRCFTLDPAVEPRFGVCRLHRRWVSGPWIHYAVGCGSRWWFEGWRASGFAMFFPEGGSQKGVSSLGSTMSKPTLARVLDIENWRGFRFIVGKDGLIRGQSWAGEKIPNTD